MSSKDVGSYRIEGIILDSNTAKGIAGVRVEAWDKDWLLDDSIGQDISNAQGVFHIGFKKSDFNDLIGENKPDIYFKLYKDNQLIHSTQDTILWNIEQEDTKVIIYLQGSGAEEKPIKSSNVLGASRDILQATYTPRKPIESEARLPRRGLEKAVFVNQLAPTIQEMEALLKKYQQGLRSPDDPYAKHQERKLMALKIILPVTEIGGNKIVLETSKEFSRLDTESLIGFARDLIKLRRGSTKDPSKILLLDQLQAMVEVEEENLSAEPVGYLHLERLSFTPAGIERGELVYSVPLSPGEEVNISHKEWSSTSEEFERIVTDFQEEFSEEGVAEKSELAQSVTSQNQHSNAINAGVTLSASYSGVNITSNFGYNAASSSNKSVQASRNRSAEITSKASSRSKQEHKMSFKVASAAGTEDHTVRLIKNPFKDRATRVDYYQLIRKWRVDLHRYGIRLTWDMIIPEPGMGLLAIIEEIKQIRAALEMGIEKPIDIIQWPGFNVKHSEILTKDELDPEIEQEDYLWLASKYGAVLGEDEIAPEFEQSDQGGWDFSFLEQPGDTPCMQTVEFDSQLRFPDYLVGGSASGNNENGCVEFQFDGTLRWTGEGGQAPKDGSIKVQDLTTGDILYLKCNIDNMDVNILPEEYIEIRPDGTRKLKDEYKSTPYTAYDVHFFDGWRDRSGKFKLLIRTMDAATLSIAMNVHLHLKPREIEAWRLRVWNAIHDAAQSTYYEKRQYLKDRLARLEDDLGSQDALSLRKKEREEVMRISLLALGIDPFYLNGNEKVIKLIQQAVEWENMLYFLYPYFWSNPEKDSRGRNRENDGGEQQVHPYWEFKKFLDHPDPIHRAFLRAGAARVILTIRPGFEEAFLAFLNGYDEKIPEPPYLSIGEELKAYAQTNYPGIPPANPVQSSRPQVHYKQIQAWKEMQVIMRLLAEFHASKHRYPYQEEGLSALHPFFPLKDPWGGSYIYKCPGQHGAYDLISYGADHKEGGENAPGLEDMDIDSWEEFPTRYKSKNQVKAWEDIQILTELLERFFKTHTRYPNSEEGLEILWEVLPLTDPWNNAYVYQYPGDYGEFDLSCFGADGKLGGDDLDADITNWSEASLIGTWFEYTPTSALDIEFDQKLPQG